MHVQNNVLFSSSSFVLAGTISQVATPVTLLNPFTHIQADMFTFKERSHNYDMTSIYGNYAIHNNFNV